MRVSCEIIRDLLPLYYDGVCSNESRAMIEEHLAECEGCKSELQLMNEALPKNNTNQNLDEAEAIKKLSKRWRKGMWKSVLKATIITILVIAVLVLIAFLVMEIEIVSY